MNIYNEMTTLELVEISNAAPAGNALRNAAEYAAKMISILGDHKIPNSANEYADLVDSLVGNVKFNFDEMLIAKCVIIHKKMAINYMIDRAFYG